MKVCCVCGESKAFTEFYKNKYAKDGHQSKCKPCHHKASIASAKKHMTPARRRRQNLKKKYGVTPEWYEATLAAQGGGCAICKTTTPATQYAVFCVDHNHTSGEVRALLCDPCNKSIGLMQEDAARLRAAADYLERFNGIAASQLRAAH